MWGRSASQHSVMSMEFDSVKATGNPLQSMSAGGRQMVLGWNWHQQAGVTPEGRAVQHSFGHLRLVSHLVILKSYLGVLISRPYVLAKPEVTESMCPTAFDQQQSLHSGPSYQWQARHWTIPWFCLLSHVDILVLPSKYMQNASGHA